jgi:DNA-binding Lrp family transcriptional regulator
MKKDWKKASYSGVGYLSKHLWSVINRKLIEERKRVRIKQVANLVGIGPHALSNLDLKPEHEYLSPEGFRPLIDNLCKEVGLNTNEVIRKMKEEKKGGVYKKMTYLRDHVRDIVNKMLKEKGKKPVSIYKMQKSFSLFEPPTNTAIAKHVVKDNESLDTFLDFLEEIERYPDSWKNLPYVQSNLSNIYAALRIRGENVKYIQEYVKNIMRRMNTMDHNLIEVVSKADYNFAGRIDLTTL